LNRHRKWAVHTLKTLKRLLGSRCAWCSRDARKAGSLEFDCIAPMGDEHHRFETNRRATFYRRMFRQANLQLLCVRCHKRKTRAQTHECDHCAKKEICENDAYCNC
jgi:hypothetical protein